MDPRLVDERDTQWESSDRPFRIVIDKQGRRATYDIEQAEFGDVVAWASSQATGDGTYSLALRITDDKGRPGLMWIIENAR